MKIYEARRSLQTAVTALDALKQTPTNVKLQHELNIILSEFNNDVLNDLKQKLNRRCKKRQKQKRNKEKYKIYIDEVNATRKKINLEADIWLKQCQEAEETAKAEESVRRQADTVLHSVTRKKSEAKRILALLNALARLRAARRQKDIAQGGKPTEDAVQTFQNSLEKLEGLWQRQVEEYNVEEAGLKVMLAEGSASRLGRLERETDSNLHGWLMAMFGEGTIPETTWNELVEVRKSWDRFIVEPDTPLSSGLPSGWLLPQPLTRQDWIEAVLDRD